MNNRNIVRLLIAALVIGFAISIFPWPARAADYPDRPIEIIAPFGPGSSTDRMTLAIIPFMEKELKQKVLPSYRSGGGGTIGTAWLAKAKADGYNLAIVPTGVMIVKPLTSNLPYSLKDFVPVAQVGIYQTVLIVREDSQWKTLAEFIDEAKKNPEKLTFGSSGPFSMGHIAMEAVKQATGMQIKHVPFEGAGKLMLALLGKQVDMVVTEIRPEFGKDGKTRMLTAVTDRRLPDHPNVPTFKELGYDLVMDVWYCLVAPKGTPQPIVLRLEGVLQKASGSAEFKEMFLKTTGAPMEFLPGKAVNEKWARDLEIIGKVVKTLGVEKK
jgi:tripartite-type tricarboxylate transporter receptor subunit TctC